MLSCLPLSGQAYIVFLCILALACTTCLQVTARCNKMITNAEVDKNHTSDLKLGSNGGAYYTEHNNTVLVVIDRILVKSNDFFVHHDEI